MIVQCPTDNRICECGHWSEEHDGDKGCPYSGCEPHTIVLVTCEERGAVIGCGSFNTEGPDSEGLYDCGDCGIWFKPYIKAKLGHQNVTTV